MQAPSRDARSLTLASLAPATKSWQTHREHRFCLIRLHTDVAAVCNYDLSGNKESETQAIIPAGPVLMFGTAL